jgi:hypothetical protein
VGFLVDKVALGQVFSDFFGFPCQSSFHQFLHNQYHLSSPGSNQGLVMWDFVMDKSGTEAGFLPSTSVSPANLHSTNFSTITITYHPRLVQ